MVKLIYFIQYFIASFVGHTIQLCTLFRDRVLRKIGEDWVFLTILGFTMALLSFIMDYAIDKCQEGKFKVFKMYCTPPIPPSAQRVFIECCPPSVSAECHTRQTLGIGTRGDVVAW